MTGSRGLLAGLGRIARGPSAREACEDRPTSYLHQVIIVDGYDTPHPLPPLIARNAQAAQSVCPAANYRLWNGHQLRAFLAQRFDRDVLAAFDALVPYSYKCDLARFCLLYELGGVYVDLGVRLMAPWTIPTGRRVAAFRDLPFITTSWTAMQTGLLWALPGQREFSLAIDLIVGNVRAQYYGSGPLHPTGPVLLGKAMLAAMVERGWNGQDPQHVGMCRMLTPGSNMPNMGYVSPEGSLVALRTKLVPGDLNHLGLAQGNNYNQLWRTRRAYGERSWTWQVSDLVAPSPDSAGPFRELRLDPPCVLLEGAYEALLCPSNPSSETVAAVRVRSLRGGDDAIEAQSADRMAAGKPVPFVVTRAEDEIGCSIGAPAGDVTGSVTIHEAPVRRWTSDNPAIRLSRGVRTEEGIVVAGTAGGLVSFGPYLTLFRGRYRLDVGFGDVGRSHAVVKVEVSADMGKHRLASAAVQASRLTRSGVISLPFECETDVRNVEFRVHAGRRASALLTSFILTRVE